MLHVTMRTKLFQVLTCFCEQICQSITYTGIEVAYINFLVHFVLSIHTLLLCWHTTHQPVISNLQRRVPIAGIKANKDVRDQMRQWNNVTDHTLEVDRDQDRLRAQEEISEGGLCAPVLT